MNGLYNQVSQLIHTRADKQLKVRPAEYPASPAGRLASSFISMLQYELMFQLFLNDKYLPDGLRENKMMAFFGMWFGGSMLSQSFTKSGAFEIYIGKKRIWSSMKSHRTPNMQDLLDAFKSANVQLRVN